MDTVPLIQRVIAILWPSFLMAGIATILFTTAFDPVLVFDNQDIGRIGLYSICFFVFWFFGAATAATTCYFLKPCATMRKIRAQQEAAKQARKANAEESTTSTQ